MFPGRAYAGVAPTTARVGTGHGRQDVRYERS